MKHTAHPPDEMLAAIGIGSNSTRLLVARRKSGTQVVTPVERLQAVTRLAGYSSAPGGHPLLDENAIHDTVSAARAFARYAREAGAYMAGAVATEAVRAAANSAGLLALLKAETGMDVRVISGEEEAELGWISVASQYGGEQGLAVIDMGGGSTDISIGLGGSPRPLALHSIPLGGRTAMRAYGLEARVEPEALNEAVAALQIALRPHLSASGSPPRPKRAVLIGGTAEVMLTLISASKDDASPSENALFSATGLRAVLASLAPMSLEERTQAGVPRDRADIIVAGGALLIALFQTWHLETFFLSERNILDGLLLSAQTSPQGGVL